MLQLRDGAGLLQIGFGISMTLKMVTCYMAQRKEGWVGPFKQLQLPGMVMFNSPSYRKHTLPLDATYNLQKQ